MCTEPVTTLKHRAAEIVDELEQTRMSLLLGITRGERAAEDGRTVSHDQAKARLARWLE